MEKFTILLRHFDVADPKEQFKIEKLEVEDKDTAWETVENNLLNSNTQAWVMNEGELKALKSLLFKDQQGAIKAVVEYLEHGEKKHYLECEIGERTDHIYNHVKALKDLLK